MAHATCQALFGVLEYGGYPQDTVPGYPQPPPRIPSLIGSEYPLNLALAGGG